MSTEETKYWFLFSTENEYNQPERAFEAYWLKKPSIEQVASALGLKFSDCDDKIVLAVVKIWSGEHGTVRVINTDYWLEKVSPNEGLSCL